MNRVLITATAWHLRDGTLENYSVDCKYKQGGSWSRYPGAKSLAQSVLFELAYDGVKNPHYIIRLSEGMLPLGKRSKGCGRVRYTQKPSQDFRKDLESYLANPSLIAEARKEARKALNEPIDIILHTPNEIIEYKGEKIRRLKR